MVSKWTEISYRLEHQPLSLLPLNEQSAINTAKDGQCNVFLSASSKVRASSTRVALSHNGYGAGINVLLLRVANTAPLFLSSFNNGNKSFARFINQEVFPMEALSVTANIVAVLQAANTIVSICCDYSAAAKGASWELPKVTKEVRSLRDVLGLLEALARRAENADLSADARLPALIRMCNSDAGPLAMCNAELESLKTKLEPPKWTGPVTSKRTALMQTITWPLKEGETKKMLQKMERYKTALSMALEIDQT